MVCYSDEAMRALAEYIEVHDKCANEPDETYRATFISMNPIRKRLSGLLKSEVLP